MDNVKILLNYCTNSLAKSKMFSNYVKQYPNFIFPLMNYDNLNNEILDEINHIEQITIMLQKKREEGLLKEIKQFNFNNIRWVGLKGCFISKVYYPSNIQRLYGDVDILSSINESYKVYKELKKSGFQSKKYSYFSFHNEIFIKILHKIFFVFDQHAQMIKNYNTFFSIPLELHANLNMVCPMCRPKFKCKRMIKESIKKEIDGYTFYILSPEDNLLYLMFHTIKHLSYILLYQNDIAINLQNFFDVAQIISLENINWSKFLNRVTEYNIEPYISIYLKMFCDIYKNTIPNDIYSQIIEKAKNVSFPWKHIYNILITMDATELIIGDFSNYPIILHTHYLASSAKNPHKVWRKFYNNSLSSISSFWQIICKIF